MTELKCLSCKKLLGTGGIIFKCPNCSKDIVRCAFCKKLGVKYRCECGFEGP